MITGAGKAFSAGADLNEMKASRSATFQENVDNALHTSSLFYEIAAAPKPVIARIHGPAMAGALGIISACDLTVAASGISFAFTEARLGIAPAMISPFVIRRVGAARAQRLFLTGETFSAEDAERFGLIDRVVAPERLDETVESICRELERCGPGRARCGQGDRRHRALRQRRSRTGATPPRCWPRCALAKRDRKGWRPSSRSGRRAGRGSRRRAGRRASS